MWRDSIFYKLFQQSPATLFELVPNPPANADAYRFDSVAVKEPKFEIDGVFLPPENTPGAVYFCEVQFQKDEQLYERIFAESALYFYRNRSRFNDWQAVVIYPASSHNTHIRAEIWPTPVIGVAGLLGLVALVDKLRANALTEQKEDPICPSDLFPPACRERPAWFPTVGTASCQPPPTSASVAQSTGHAPAELLTERREPG